MSDASEAVGAANGREEPYPPKVAVLELDGRRLVLVGTAHVSRSSVELVRQVIEREQPDRVCVELDPQRYQALVEKKRWESLDLKTIIRRKQLPTLIANLVLASYQKRLGAQLGIEPGRELLEAVHLANSRGVPLELCDRDVRVTLRRAARAVPPFHKLMLFSELLVAMFDGPEISEEELTELKEQDVLTELLEALGRRQPALKRVLIDERDAYLAEKIRRAGGERLVAVVGAGHLRGLRQQLETAPEVDLEALETVPAGSSAWRHLGWIMPVLILGAVAWIGWQRGPEAAGDNLAFWFFANAVPTALGALLALAHPLTIAAGFFAAPFTSLTPMIGAGYVTAFVQAYLRPPVVAEFHSVADDVGQPRRWWQSKLLRIFLAFLLPGFGSLIGSLVGGGKILSSLF